MTTVLLNGERRELPLEATVATAVREAGIEREGRGVAVDGEVVPRGRWSDTALREGQQIEVLHAVQGG
jgi:sulfur carrier protein